MTSVLQDSPSTYAQVSASRRSVDWIVISLLLIGAGLRLFQYLVRSSFWGDELAIISNVTSRHLLNLVTYPLARAQMAPSGFLALLKVVIGVGGTSECSFRFIPLLSSLLALPLFAKLARKCLSRPAMLLALAAFAVSPPLIRYAAQVKPYASDVALCLLCLLAAHSWLTQKSRLNALWLGLAGAVAIWFSYPVMFVLASIGLIALWRCATRWSAGRSRQTAVVFGLWLLAAGPLALVERHRLSPGTHAFMLSFWSNWLMPYDKGLYAIREYIVRLGRDCLSDFLHLPRWPVFLVLLVIGLVRLVRRSRTQNTALIVLPILLALLASLLRIYPFSGRLILFLVPNFFLSLSAGVEQIVEVVSRLGPVATWRSPLTAFVFLAAALPVCALPLLRAGPPFHNSETKPMIAYLGEHRHDGDAIYVHNMAWGAYLFYGPRFELHKDEAIETSPWNALGPKPQVILRDLDRFRGRPRVWVLFGGGYPVESSCAVKYLRSIGICLDRQSSFNSNLYLFDLSASEHSRYRSAADFLSHELSDPACAYGTSNPIGPQH